MVQHPAGSAAGLGLAVATLGAFGLRVGGIASLGDLDFDEQASFFIGSMAPGEMLSYLLGAPFEHPPLFYLLFHGWLAAAGGSETAMRLFAVLPGTLAVPLVGTSVARVAGTRAGVVAALAMAVAPLHVFYSRDARMYSLLALLMAIMLAALVVGAGRQPGSWWSRSAGAGPLLVAGVAGATALATHYYAAFAVLGVSVGLWRARGSAVAAGPTGSGSDISRGRPLWPLALAGAAILAGGAWVAGASGLRTSLSAVQLRAVDPGQLSVAVAASLGAPFAGPLAAPEGVLVAAALTLGPVVWLESGRRRARKLLCWWSLKVGMQREHPPPSSSPARGDDPPPSPTAARGEEPPSSRLLHAVAFWGFALTSVGIPLLLLLGRPFAPRFVVLGAPFVAVLLGLSSVGWSTRLLAVAGGVYGVAALAALAPMYSGLTRSDYGQAMVALRDRARPDDAIILNGPWQEILYQRYGWGLPPRYIIASTVPLDVGEAVGWLERLSASHRRLWVVDSATDAADPTGAVARWLDARAYPGPVQEFRKALLRPYLTDYPEKGELRAQTVDFTALGLRIETVALEERALEPGGEARLRIGLREIEPAISGSGERRLAAQLVGPSGAPVWHWDGVLTRTADRLEYRAAVMLPREAPPGLYAVRLLVYERGTSPDGSRPILLMSEAFDAATVRVTRHSNAPPQGGRGNQLDRSSVSAGLTERPGSKPSSWVFTRSAAAGSA